MNVLSLHEDSNANLALVTEKRVVFAVAEERLTRNRFQTGFPDRSLEALERHTGIGRSQIDAVVAGNRFHVHSRLPLRFPTYEHPFIGLSQKAMLLLQHQMHRRGFGARTAEEVSERFLKHRFGRDVPLIDHHTAHAYSAYLPSGFAEATAITIDNFGDGYSASVFRCRDGKAERLYGSDALHSPGQFYGEMAQLLGFHPLLAGKVTALAALGDPRRSARDVEPLFGLSSDEKDFELPSLRRTTAYRTAYRALQAAKPEDVAAAVQARFEEVILPYARRAVRETGFTNVVLAGGVFANVAVNRRIAELPEVTGVYVQPAMSDQGIALGAALAFLSEHQGIRSFELEHVYLGPSYAEPELRAAAEASGLRFRRMDDPEDEIAEILARGEGVARFDGALEFGPRALGNRSILWGATDPELPGRLNRALHRASFMPFAPATLDEKAGERYGGLAKARRAARFMTMAFPCTDRLRSESPSVVHVDGSARPQLVTREHSPSFHRLLSCYESRTGIPTLLNTSFNLHEEPIVCSPQDALRALSVSGLTYLALGPFLVERAP